MRVRTDQFQTRKPFKFRERHNLRAANTGAVTVTRSVKRSTTPEVDRQQMRYLVAGVGVGGGNSNHRVNKSPTPVSIFS
jgi:hypothetical protein